jgi:hypothetical protein
MTAPTTPRPPRPNGGGDGSGGPWASAASVAGLAREVETVRLAVADLAGLPARVDQVAALVATLADDLAALTAAEESRRVQPSWLGLPAGAPPEQAAQLLADLAAWVGEVYLRYPTSARGLPACWLWHPDVVEELLWLRRAWKDAYVGAKSSIAAVGDWHDRLRPGVATRVQQAAGSCSIENHLPARIAPPGPDAATGGVPAAEAIEPIACWWAIARDAVPPEPTPDQLAASATTARTPRTRR